MKKLVAEKFIVLSLLFPTLMLAGCSSSKDSYSKNVVYHCYQGFGGSSKPDYYPDRGYVLDGQNVLRWSKVGDEEKNEIAYTNYRVLDDGLIILHDGNRPKSFWGRITIDILEIFMEGESQWCVTETFYESVIKAN